MPKVLSEAQVAGFHREGFLSPVDVMSADEAGRYRRAFEAAEQAHPDAFSGVGRNHAHLVLTDLDALAHHPRILDAVEELLGPDIMICGTVLFIKEPGDPGFVSWHQDATYMGLEPHSGIAAWLALSPSDRESGCMHMIPGSHKGEIRPHKDTFGGANILTRGQNIEDVDEDAAVELLLAPGQMSFHHARIIHGSQPNLGSDRRIGFVIQSYLPPDVRQTKGECYAQLARGTDPYGHFLVAPRPQRDMAPADVARRERANALWSEILYAGAERRRDF